MKDRAVALRYARAIAQTLGSDEELDKAVHEMESVARLVETEDKLGSLLRNPALPRSRRAVLVEMMIDAARLSAKTARLLKLIDSNDRFSHVPEIARVLRRLRDERLGIVEAELTTAVPLDDGLSRDWELALAGVTGRTVRLKRRVDPMIIGGAVARIGSVVYDGSLRSRLASLRRRLVGT